MIKANELRKGNWVEGQTPQRFTTIAFIPARDELDVNPIPITREILEKIKIKGKHFCDEFFLETNMSGVLMGHRPHGVKYLRQIKYVHQLQNLYFDLFGEELPIEL